MSPDRFIARKLKFQGKLAAASIAVSFLVIIVAVAVSSGFRQSVRDGVARLTGDIRIAPTSAFAAEGDPIPVHLPSEEAILGISGVQSVRPVAVRAGIVRSGDIIHGVLVKGVPDRPDSSLCVSIPTRLAAITGLKEGDDMTTYFVGEKVRVRKFHVTAVHRDLLEMDENLVVYANLSDIQRLNGWSEDQASALEVSVDPSHRTNMWINDLTDEIGMRLLLSGEEGEDGLVATSSVRTYAQIFDWLDLLDFNVLVILILMIVVAGVNMISGLLIVLFRNIATIGTLKTLGMGDRAIGKVFLRVSAGVVLKGMLVGNAVGLLLCFFQQATHLMKLDPTNYFVSYVPVHVDIPWVLAADFVAFVAIMLLLLIPTLFIARVDPAQTVKAE
ncbi:MAG: ABC transporter permease [Bacteroidales bacterium]|nr:ABC transporter permease [Bacteroidales bacterium]